jgi:hypothetical protein
MSAPIAAEVLREFGAEVRRFRSARHALLWYRDQLARRLQATRQGFEQGAGPRSREARDQAQATFAAIAQCLRARPSDDDEERAAMRGECVVWLVASYEARWGDLTLLSERADMTRWAFTRRCARTERYLAARLRAAGLLVQG